VRVHKFVRVNEILINDAARHDWFSILFTPVAPRDYLLGSGGLSRATGIDNASIGLVVRFLLH
jgi:hypothetical protein